MLNNSPSFQQVLYVKPEKKEKKKVLAIGERLFCNVQSIKR